MIVFAQNFLVWVYLEDTSYEYGGNADTLLMNGVETSKGSSK